MTKVFIPVVFLALAGSLAFLAIQKLGFIEYVMAVQDHPEHVLGIALVFLIVLSIFASRSAIPMLLSFVGIGLVVYWLRPVLFDGCIDGQWFFNKCSQSETLQMYYAFSYLSAVCIGLVIASVLGSRGEKQKVVVRAHA